MDGESPPIKSTPSFFIPVASEYSRPTRTVLGRRPEDFISSYGVLNRYGNMSSATVLFVLEDQLRKMTHRSGAYGLLAAFGPGFSAETTLVQWT